MSINFEQAFFELQDIIIELDNLYHKIDNLKSNLGGLICCYREQINMHALENNSEFLVKLQEKIDDFRTYLIRKQDIITKYHDTI